MAKKRMFSMDVIDTDRFLEMPPSAQSLYFHLGMRGDDDGFVSSPKRIMRTVGSADDDLKLLIAKNFIIPFASGIVVIVDWQLNNTLRNDRYHETIYLEEKSHLTIDKNTGKYTVSAVQMATERVTSGIPSVTQRGYQMEPEHNITKLNETKQRGMGGKPPRAARFTPPTIEEVKAYCRERENNVDAERFIDFYASKGWKIGKNAMKDWRAAVRTWERSSSADCAQPKRQGDGFTYDYSYTEGSL